MTQRVTNEVPQQRMSSRRRLGDTSVRAVRSLNDQVRVLDMIREEITPKA